MNRGDPPPRRPEGWRDPVDEARARRRRAITSAALQAVATIALAVICTAQYRINRDTGEILRLQRAQIEGLYLELTSLRHATSALAAERLERSDR